MRKNIRLMIALFFISNLFLLTSCNDWVNAEPNFDENLTEPAKSPEYYAQLRAWKKTDHALSFGWYGGATGLGASMASCFSGLPDSTDLVSIWSGERTEAFLADMRYCQQVKGIRFLKCKIIGTVPPEFGWTDPEPVEGDPVMEKAIRDYANSICDEVDSVGYDGFDIDYEPTVGGIGAKGNLSLYKISMEIFIDELSKRLGPKSGTDKILAVDGEANHAHLREFGHHFNYFISQSYNTRNNTALNNKLKNVVNNYTKAVEDENRLTAEEVARKFITAENFEDYAQTGGAEFTDDNGNVMRSLEGMARWNPVIDGKVVRKGGCGSFHMEYEYFVPGYPVFYPFLRNSIQVMNPSLH